MYALPKRLSLVNYESKKVNYGSIVLRCMLFISYAASSSECPRRWKAIHGAIFWGQRVKPVEFSSFRYRIKKRKMYVVDELF